MGSVDYEAVFEKAEVGIALNDPETGTIGEVNERYASLLGYGREELRGEPIETISADDSEFDQEAAMERIQLALEGQTQRFDWLFERKDRSRFWGEVVLKRTAIGDEDRLLAFVSDITDRKQTIRELERKNQRLDQFASIVSHDLRNPLSVAMGRLELAKDECDSDELEKVSRAHGRMESLIEELLTLARAGDTVGQTDTVDLDVLVERCWQTLETDTAQLVVDADTELDADEARLQQAMENLLRNGVEHGGDGVTIRVGSNGDGFYVEDDGPGIPPDKREEVLEPGYTTAEGGTGFGLNIVRDIAHAHDWTVDVTASPDGGARFEFGNVRTA